MDLTENLANNMRELAERAIIKAGLDDLDFACDEDSVDHVFKTAKAILFEQADDEEFDGLIFLAKDHHVDYTLSTSVLVKKRVR